MFFTYENRGADVGLVAENRSLWLPGDLAISRAEKRAVEVDNLAIMLYFGKIINIFAP